MSDELSVHGLHQVALTTRDIHRSSKFYRDTLGLRQIAVFDPPGLAFFNAGGVRLSVQQNSEMAPSNSVIYFKVSDIDSAVEILMSRSVTFEQEPEMVFRDEHGQFGKAGEEEWMAFFRDPDGNLLALASRKES